ncbi:carboxylating nicotinate-nucleotide diphosphorylase [Methanobacterium petrolearium]|uniref:carboxylating nicotinate-nucleotide diphosphorylase n=1 Tax=Methanobacterium petrolearium TaxID=710190 RepID=UPI001AE27D93|nr:carboxylating nicotinate-nucleotide diphosphorylase [Methanobacterium petrolearium]MBP1945686.1 nicotinate-nucleotide pyrophosphorylase (carboxylating) [Methanobacterium petrolearium]
MRSDLARMIYDDIGFEDITTCALIPPGLNVKGQIISKEAGTVAGVELAFEIFRKFGVETEILKNDGEKIRPGQIIMKIEGDPRNILTLERTVLNLMMRMSGIATLTSKMVEMVRKVNPDVLVAGTRKTTPGLQFFEKKAIRSGGGDTHRYRLDDAILIKDNHLALVGGVTEALSRARKYASFTKKIEIEVETMEEALEAARVGADIIMLDNMSPNEVKNVLTALDNGGLRDDVLIEVSGNINPDNIMQFAKTGADVISAGYITHSAKSLDLSLDLEKMY